MPGNPWYPNFAPLTLGVKFRSDVPGAVNGIRFYKGAGNNGPHIGLLYNSAGTLLAQATFTGETASGWQQVNFSSPVPIAAGTTYVGLTLRPRALPWIRTTSPRPVRTTRRCMPYAPAWTASTASTPLPNSRSRSFPPSATRTATTGSTSPSPPLASCPRDRIR